MTDLLFAVEHWASTPMRGTAGSAGFDLFAQDDVLLIPGGLELVRTGVRVELPRGHVGLLCLRSWCGRHGVIMPNAPGIIDEDYRGELCVSLYNVSSHRCRLYAGDRIAQLVVLPMPALTVFYSDELSDTDRGTEGFGSTGR
jgi:dUTP pyrophosphatase